MMRTPYDDSDGFDFADSPAVRRIVQEQKREEMRHVRRRNIAGPGDHDPDDDFDDDDDDDFDDDDYDENDFDSYSGLSIDH
jgi:casein kinase II subunit beta